MILNYVTCSLSWAESITAFMPFLCVALINLFNEKFINIIKNPTTAATIKTNGAENEIIFPINTVPTTKIPNSSNNDIKKQKSEDYENSSSVSASSSSQSVSSSPPLTARHSLNLNENGNIAHALHIPSPPESFFSDEYHEDEDTLSLENLFPCDQSEIYASKKISFIIDELIQTESNYVNNLRKGLQNYGNLLERNDLPDALQGNERQQQLLGNIAEVTILHEEQILPMMLRNQRDLKQLFDDFAAYFDKNQFYVYVTFTMNKKHSMQLRQDNREWFQTYQTEIKDKLGIDSFLVQPIQRLTRYPLLLQQFISEFYKSGISCKPVLVSLCKLETRMRRLLEVVNQAEAINCIEELGDFNLKEQSHFRKTTEFDVYHHRSRKKFHAKILIFDRCLVCVEVRKRRLAYRHHYVWETLDLQLNNAKTISVLHKANGGTFKEEMELSSPESISITQWLRLARKVGEVARVEASQRDKFSLPMDLVLGVLFAIWLIWVYL